MNPTSLENLCQHLSTGTSTTLTALLPNEIQQEAGHFNVFDLDSLPQPARPKPTAPFPCRAYYKISLLSGRSRAEYPDKIIDLDQHTLVFSTPKTPFYWLPQSAQGGQFCVFTAEFLLLTKSGVMLDELPIFRSGEYPVFHLTDEQYAKIESVFQTMQAEIRSDYTYKYDLLRTYVLELIHYGQKLQSTAVLHPPHTASARLTSLFVERLEQQFPIETPQQRVRLRTANHFADDLSVHINYLNKVLKETTGLTTTELIGGRLVQEAKILLKQTDWSISEISDSLGFSDSAHFSKFFKRETSFTPGIFRTQDDKLNYTKFGFIRTIPVLAG